ncbi:MAG: GIY-YIG nuclease family protein [Candidatus Omnitrophica bacterium]|nr:GIY-YIG nuclease family protein [Candidatus Omnitrophota bacterium]
MAWHVYIIECKDGKFYTGITKDLKRRLREHDSGNGCKYTSCRAPVKLVHSEKALNRSRALKREAQIKQLSREAKLKLIKRVDVD